MKVIILNIFNTIGIALLSAATAVFLYLQFPAKPTSTAIHYNNWESGTVKHILPSFDHRQLLMKISLEEGLRLEPLLKIGTHHIKGSETGTDGKFWKFYTDSLLASKCYDLRILKNNGDPITDPWNITTFPHPDSNITSLKALLYTCAGGISESFFGQEVFLDMNARRALLLEGLIHNPDIVIANGDHVYWDQKTFEISLIKRLLLYRRNRQYGKLDLTKPMLHPSNYDKFTSIIDDQITELYGCLLREKSVYFLSDDHDLLENDEALEDIVSLPPKPYMLDAARTTQQLYYPEFLSNRNKPHDFPDHIPRKNGLSTSFGIIRYGSLAEFNLYDCKRYCTIDGPNVYVIPPKVERWLAERQGSNSNWVVQVPSSPFGYTAGKWAEWYPDVLDENGSLSIKLEKHLWQKEWWNQHQRILKTMYSSAHVPIIVQGDLHMASAGKIISSGELNFVNKPINIITTAPLGSGKLGFPSSVRNTGAKIPALLEVEEDLPPLEKNGFTIVQISKQNFKYQIYTWRPSDDLSKIIRLTPIYETIIMNSSIPKEEL